MALDAGTRLGNYQVVSSLGVGGMGEVYRARDDKLGREVAIKVLPEGLASDPERMARFDREAKALAALNHPNIATLHGYESDGERQFLVMELVEGETLAERIQRGAVPVEEALPLFAQIARGLEAAHERGVIHRDLKPANVKITPDGTLKILDFGLAKAMAVDGRGDSDVGLSQSPTLTLAATQRGEILGTAAYMSPEQAKGRVVDRRTDVWAFGICLYEALIGRRVFEGEDAADTLAAVLRAELDWESLPPLPPALRRLLERCLERNPDERLRDIGDARLELRDAERAPEPSAAEEVAPLVSTRSPWPLALAALVAGLVLAGVAAWTLKPVPARPLVRSVLSAPPSAPTVVSPFRPDIAISADGRRVVYQVDGSLYLRRVDELEGRSLPGTEAGGGPFLSPDSVWLGFIDGSTLKKVSLLGGPPVIVADAGAAGVPTTASWEEDGTIYFALVNGDIQRVPAGGGDPETVVELDREVGEVGLGFPQLLPGGGALLVSRILGDGFDQSQVAVVDLETLERTVLVPGGGMARYVRSGHLVYAVADGLRAVAFDADAREVTSDPVPVLQEVVTKLNTQAGSFAVSADGSLAYVSGIVGRAGLSSLVWVSREGREEAIAAPARNYRYPEISPDGSRLAVGDQGVEQDVWIWDFGRQTETRLTRHQSADFYNLWTPDSRQLLYASGSGVDQDIYRRAADGTGARERLTENPRPIFPSSLSSDGRFLVYRLGQTSSFDLEMLDLESGEARPLLAADYDELNGDLSPDGRFLAYQSNESGEFEIYVCPFPDVDARRWKISTAGGGEPKWSSDGSELFYRAGDRMMAVPIRSEPSLEAGTPEELFSGSYARRFGRMYDTVDGRRFLMIKPPGGGSESGPGPQVVLVEGWFEELERLVPTG